MDSILNINNLSYGLYNDLSVSFESGKYYAIIGCNNSGKTLLFNLISGIIGTTDFMNCNGITLSRETVNEYIKQIGVVPKLTKYSFIYKKVSSELHYPLHNLGYSLNESNELIQGILKDLNLTNILNKKINDIDLNEKVMLLFILALLHNPKVLIIDDMFTLLDLEHQLTIRKYIKDLVKKNKLTVINFSCNVHEALYADYLYVINNGNIVSSGKPKEILGNEKMFNDNNLELPTIIKLSSRLIKYDLIDHNYVNTKELVDDIWK